MKTEKLTETIRTRIDAALMKRIQRANKGTYKSPSQFLREAVLEKLNREEKEAA